MRAVLFAIRTAELSTQAARLAANTIHENRFSQPIVISPKHSLKYD
jgi:hypothetical protein